MKWWIDKKISALHRADGSAEVAFLNLIFSLSSSSRRRIILLDEGRFIDGEIASTVLSLDDRKYLEDAILGILRVSPGDSCCLGYIVELSAAIKTRSAVLALLDLLNRVGKESSDILKGQIFYNLKNLVSELNIAEIPICEIEVCISRVESELLLKGDDYWNEILLSDLKDLKLDLASLKGGNDG